MNISVETSSRIVKVKDQETWSQLVNGTKKLPKGYCNQLWGNEIRAIWVPDNRFHGYVIHQPSELVCYEIFIRCIDLHCELYAIAL